MTLGPLASVRDVSLRMLRNKRRSMAMLMGVVFCVLIISSVSLFNDVLVAYLMNLEIDNIPYMIEVTPSEEARESQMLDLAEKVRSDKRAKDAEVIGGPAPMKEVVGGFERSSSPDVEWSVNIQMVPENPEGISWSIPPIFLRDSFVGTDIFDRSMKHEMAGTFDLWSGNRTVIPRTFSDNVGITVGDVVPKLTVQARSYEGRTATNHTLVLENVTVSGITDWVSLMSYYTGREEAYFSTDLLYTYDNTLLPFLEENGYFSVIVRLDLKEFKTQDKETFDNEVGRFANDIAQKTDVEVSTAYFTGFMPAAAAIMISVILMFVFLVLTLPVLALSIYLLVFGLELSLEDRRREIGILKAQGASSWQIFRMLAAESGLLLMVGVAAGFVMSFFVAWAMISITGFLTFDFSSEKLDIVLNSNVSAFIKAFLWSTIVVSLIVVLLVFRKGRSFIDMEVSEAVQRGEKKKPSIIRRLKIDLILFIIGLIAGGYIIINDLFGSSSNEFGTTSCLLALAYFFGPFALWVGGAMVGPPVASWLLLRGQKLVLRLPAFSDIGLVLKSGLKRRTHVAGLAALIILAMSVATVAATQSYTDQMHFEREAEFKVGADLNVGTNGPTDLTNEIEAVPGVAEVCPVLQTYLITRSRGIDLYAIDAEHADILLTHDDSFKDMTAKQAFAKLREERDHPGVLVDSDTAYWDNINVGDEIEVEFYLAINIPTDGPYGDVEVPDIKDPYGDVQSIKFKFEVVGIFDHMPPGIDEGLVCDLELVRDMQRVITGEENPEVVASTYLVDLDKDADRTEVKREIRSLAGVSTVLDLEEEKDFEDTFGISGLLTLMLALSLVGLVVGSFTFSSILMQRRMREFALLQTLGATRGQVYKVAVGENILLLTLVIVWGVVLGLILSYVVNGFFFVIRQMFEATMLERTIFIPWPLILGMAVLALLGMIVVMIVSAIKAARQDLSVSTRVI